MKKTKKYINQMDHGIKRLILYFYLTVWCSLYTYFYFFYQKYDDTWIYSGRLTSVYTHFFYLILTLCKYKYYDIYYYIFSSFNSTIYTVYTFYYIFLHISPTFFIIDLFSGILTNLYPFYKIYTYDKYEIENTILPY